MDDIIKDDNLHIKFVDAFLNLVTRVLNLPVNQLFEKISEFNFNLTILNKNFFQEKFVKKRIKRKTSIKIDSVHERIKGEASIQKPIFKFDSNMSSSSYNYQ